MVWMTGARFPASLHHHVQTGTLGPTQPPIQCVLEGLKWSMNEAGHSPPSSAEVKNAWNYTSTPIIHLKGVVPN
jgi:hypothetical protein